ncbi:hypothetical protein ONZ45_g543 [Pleurotus djamor]|nr:hypothetical protein ONZ45_g543 [Pleurotus djamor]
MTTIPLLTSLHCTPLVPSASLSSSTETHAATAAGIFRAPGSPLMALGRVRDIVTDLSIESGGLAIDRPGTFTRNSRFPGAVKIIVESTTLTRTPSAIATTNRLGYTHRARKEVRIYASPFFEATLSGNCSETCRPPSMSSVITTSQPPSDPGDFSLAPTPGSFPFAPKYFTPTSEKKILGSSMVVFSNNLRLRPVISTAHSL